MTVSATAEKGASISLPNFIRACKEERSFTPDMFFLNSHIQWAPVFIYGCEKIGFSEADFMNECPVLGRGWTIASAWALLKTKEHNEPVVVQSIAEYDPARIQGDCYLAPIEKLFDLDARFNNGLYFHRRIQAIRYIPLDQKDNKEKVWSTAEMYMYSGDTDFWRQEKLKNPMTPCRIVYPTQAAPYYVYAADDDAPNRIANKKERIRQCL